MGVVYNKHGQVAGGLGQVAGGLGKVAGGLGHVLCQPPASPGWHTHNLSKVSALPQIQRTSDGCGLQ
jgi:hypothetical protein